VAIAPSDVMSPISRRWQPRRRRTSVVYFNMIFFKLIFVTKKRGEQRRCLTAIPWKREETFQRRCFMCLLPFQGGDDRNDDGRVLFILTLFSLSSS
jgi:hypothetical protein